MHIYEIVESMSMENSIMQSSASLLMSIIDITDEDEAIKLLKLGDLNVESAVNLYFTQQGESLISKEKRKIRNEEGFNDMESVRVPDKIKKQRLVEDSQYTTGRGLSKISNSLSTFASTSKFSTFQKEEALSKIFESPLDITTIGAFVNVKDQALEMDRWLLVNLQRDSEFNSHILNRDFWRDSGVKDMVQCSFVFWQQSDVSGEGKQFTSRYKVVEFPHISIIDPRTGALVWKHEGDLNCRLLTEKIQDFLGSFPIPSEYRSNKIRRSTSGQNIASRPPVDKCPPAKDNTSSKAIGEIVDLVREDEEDDAVIKHAVQLSLGSKVDAISGTSSSSSSSIASVISQPGFPMNFKASYKSEVVEGNNAMKAAFNFPGNTKRIFKQLYLSSTVEDVVEFVATELQKLSDKVDPSQRFEISFDYPRQNLSELIIREETQTLTSLGIQSGIAFFVTML